MCVCVCIIDDNNNNKQTHADVAVYVSDKVMLMFNGKFIHDIFEMRQRFKQTKSVCVCVVCVIQPKNLQVVLN